MEHIDQWITGYKPPREAYAVGQIHRGMSSANDNRLDDDEDWIDPTLMLGSLMRVAVVVFVPFIALLVYFYNG